MRVQALCPGLVRTEFHERMGMNPGQFPAAAVMTPEAVVEASLAGLRLGEVLCVPALDDPSLLTQIKECERRVLEYSGGGAVAGRYRL